MSTLGELVRILVLGPVEIRADDTPVTLGGPKPKALLSVLLLQARQVVPIERLIDRIWDGDPPQSATALVHTYVSSLRRGFAAVGRKGVLVTRAPGYLLDVGHGDSDLEDFAAHVGAARQAERGGDYETAAREFAAAVGLWRGLPFGGVDSGFTRSQSDRLIQERLGAEEGLARCKLVAGRAEEVADQLRRLVANHPLREESRGLLMRSLFESGRQADALEVYREGRTQLLDELGLEPGEKLRELQSSILDGTLRPLATTPRAPVAARVVPAPRPSEAPVPRLLPPDIGDFTGRDEPLATVLAFGEPDSARTAVPTVVISGFGGAGKSTLAIHAAHLLRTHYPDGQLFADLRGSDRDLGAFEVLGRFLGAFGVTGADLPATLDDRVELYRRKVAGRKLVIVLDNAREEQQVRPLLPGDANCLVIITSRSRLAGLQGIEPVELDFFDTAAGVEMLGNIIGADRVESQRAEAERIADLCGGIPLAIRAAAAKLLARPHWPLKSLASRLSDEHRRLDELAIGDLAIRSSLRLNYTELDDVQRRAFHLLCLLDLPDFGWWLAAPLLDVSLEDAEDIVEQLVELRLLDVAGVDAIGRVRYRFHDLVQLFGAEHAVGDEPSDLIAAAVSRTLATWMALVEAGSRKLPRVTLGLRPALTSNVDVDPRLIEETEAEPTNWLKSETAAVVRAVERAHDLGIDGMTTLLITSLLSSPFAARNEFDGWQRTHEVALRAARCNNDRQAEAVVLAGLGQLYYEKDDFPTALDHFEQALGHAETIGDDGTRAVALVGIGTVRRDLAQFADAQRDLTAAAESAEANGDDPVLAAARYGLGAISRDHGDLDSAASQFRRCVELYQKIDDRRGEALALRGLSLCHRAAGEYAEAVDLSAEAARLLLEAGDELGAIYARQSWAKARLRMGETDGVADALAACLRICTAQCDRFGGALMTRTVGELHLALGELPRAREALLDALAKWSELELPLWQARTLRDLAAADPERADEHWARARELFAQTGARELAEIEDLTPADWRDHVRLQARL
ncbi:AfsR/SARP family transcriptional regulator [Actinokineospora xionganensis]|uniref:Tetratricopeptide repeat protein n=1 Tax=Actinokineospora xionganensis TaxID=2684470 RepID=A0ABR7L2E7_9PSEU|nr:BTAD domain-containing putative transcriptional regulator [Actinokineospora xionganensis]MBC6446863.1 tetratricopeptide repeat protein [Actinokineospora xionganensis]